jgi:hypothetical protein
MAVVSRSRCYSLAAASHRMLAVTNAALAAPSVGGRPRASCHERLRCRTTNPSPVPSRSQAVEENVVLAESAGRALLVVMDRLTPAERVALVLHGMFTVSFGEIAPSWTATRLPILLRRHPGPGTAGGG